MRNKDSDPKPNKGQGRHVNEELTHRQAELKARNLACKAGTNATPGFPTNKKRRSANQTAEKVTLSEVDLESLHDPTANFIEKFRAAQDLTRSRLAELVGSTQREIYMAESGYGTPLSLAVPICEALKKPMWDVFPGTKESLKRIPPGADILGSLMGNTEAMHKAGIDVAMGSEALKVRMRGGLARLFPISGIEKSRLWEALQYDVGDAWIRVAIRCELFKRSRIGHLRYVSHLIIPSGCSATSSGKMVIFPYLIS